MRLTQPLAHRYTPGKYYVGAFAPPTTSPPTKSQEACVAECLKEPKCVAMTYSARPNDPCELYTSITTKQNGDPTGLCHGFVKCAAASASAGAAACAHFSAPAPGPAPGPSLPPGIRYHGVMEGLQEHPQNVNTCCEGQGTRCASCQPSGKC